MSPEPRSEEAAAGHAGVGKVCQHLRRYGLTCKQYDALWGRAKGRCEICRALPSETPRGELVIDHAERAADHYVRGILCDRCNTVMACVDGNKPWGANRKWEPQALVYARNAIPMSTRHTPHQRFRVKDELWAAYGTLVGDRSADIRAYIDWRIANPDLELPGRIVRRRSRSAR